MIKSLAVLTVLSVATGMLMAQAPGADSGRKTPQVCQLISANPPDFNPYKFIPKVVDFKRLNRYPKVEYVVDEDGNVSDVKIVKGTGSPKVDAGLVKSIQAWKYKPEPGCRFDTSVVVMIDIGQS